jgi:multidrug efflux pump subunit AcrA (membrane-fusion protein)
MRSFESIKTPLIIKSVSYISIAVIFCLLAALFLPWRQTITGEGKVTVFSPMERPQSINSLIDARISKWHINEGQMVKQGDLLLELVEVNDKYLDQNQLQNLKGQQAALFNKRYATENLINSLEQQINSQTELQSATIQGAEQNFKTAELNYDRRLQLFDKGLSSTRDLELAKLDIVKAKAGLEMARNSLKIQETEAKLAQSYEKLASINSEIFKFDIEISNFESRVDQRKIYAPLDGQVVRLKILGQGEIIKSGTELAIIAPLTSDQAIELYVSDVFAPLLSVGRVVRLQFSGFPAVQFSGWPSVAVGTFAGRVTAIDASSDLQNQYRILVQPDYKKIKEGDEVKWPTPDVLRPGTKAVGWIILDEVPMWYELWRVLNGFPPTIIYTPEKQGLSKIKAK